MAKNINEGILDIQKAIIQKTSTGDYPVEVHLLAMDIISDLTEKKIKGEN